jgi:acyl-CoA reductase-like NAD-dependent aldehyde dehydrogenase
MSAVNDLEGCTYMSQSLPFGGCKKSGYDRFAGPEGASKLAICEFIFIILPDFFYDQIQSVVALMVSNY